MKNIENIVEQIKNLEKKLSLEIQSKEEEFFYKIRGEKVDFDESTKRYHKSQATKLYPYIVDAEFFHVLVAPVILFGIVPALFMDLFATIYQIICFPVYKIPRVDRKNYIVIDRHSLQYLNILEKLNCVYCGYFNGLISYVQEIAARTEQYWCPIKHARKVGMIHSRYRKYLDYGDGSKYRTQFEKIRRDFEGLD